MKIEELIYKTPEMSEEKLLKLISEYKRFLRKNTIKRLNEFYKHENSLEKCILNEWDKIQEKNSYLTKSQRDEILAIVSTGLVSMTKGYGES